MAIDKVQIGKVEISPGLILAPMSGVTNSAFRRLILRHNPGAVGLVVTEFVSVEGLTRDNRRSLQMIKLHPDERPASVQIFGFDIERMVASAKLVEDQGADILDINSGCPVPKVVKRGGGCELMRNPEHLARMLEAVSKAISIPLTLKIRAGWDSNSRNAVEIARLAEQAGVQMLTVHGRTRQEHYRGNADWDLIGEVARSVRIPVVGSGDIVDPASAAAGFEKGVSGLMIGREALANPWVFSWIHEQLRGQEYVAPRAWQVADVMREYQELLFEELPERAVIGRMKQMASQATRKVAGSAPVRKALCQAQTLADFNALLLKWREELMGRELLS